MDMSCTKCCFFSQSHGDKVCGGLWPKAGGNHGRDQVHGDAGLLCARTGTQCGTAGQFLAVSASVCLPFTGTAGRFLPVSASVCLPSTGTAGQFLPVSASVCLPSTGTAGQLLPVSASVCLPSTGTAGRFLPVSASVCLPSTGTAGRLLPVSASVCLPSTGTAGRFLPVSASVCLPSTGTAGRLLPVSASVCLPSTGTAGRLLPVSASVCLPLTLVSHIIKLFFSFLDHAVCLLFRLFKPACWCLCRLSDQIDVLDYLSCLRCACIQCAFFFFKAFDERGFELFWSVQVQHFEQSPIYINHLQNYFFFIWAFIQTMACLQTYTSERQTGWLVLPLSWSDVQV